DELHTIFSDLIKFTICNIDKSNVTGNILVGYGSFYVNTNTEICYKNINTIFENSINDVICDKDIIDLILNKGETSIKLYFDNVIKQRVDIVGRTGNRR